MFNDVITLVVDLRECGKWAMLPLHYKLEFTTEENTEVITRVSQQSWTLIVFRLN